MTREDILRRCDHTLLKRDMSSADMKRVCDEAIEYKTASVCLPPHFVAPARRYAGEDLVICTVIGFPNGYSTTRAKCEEAREAVKNGASELDMVVNLPMLKDRFYQGIIDDINSVKAVCGENILKVIIETCLLTEDEKITLCKLVSESGAEFVKTSTGFEKGGATREDIALMRRYSAPHIRIKAAGGIATFEDAEDFILLGADRLGTSRLVALAKRDGSC
jgi:deoxyribose-phosphate aldolase